MSDHGMSVDRCVCVRVRFDRILKLHRERGHSLEQIQELTGAGLACGCCQPYLRLTLATGRTSHPVLDPDAAGVGDDEDDRDSATLSSG
jgi:bacterioferritin-associated ferredoxin